MTLRRFAPALRPLTLEHVVSFDDPRMPRGRYLEQGIELRPCATPAVP
jgi:hypothetical protein